MTDKIVEKELVNTYIKNKENILNILLSFLFSIPLSLVFINNVLITFAGFIYGWLMIYFLICELSQKIKDYHTKV